MQNINFGQALEALKQGSKVARNGWTALKWVRHINFVTDNEFTIMEHNPCEGTVVPTFAKLSSNNELELGWRPSTSDMLAEDWCIVN